jgi:hypothetical protein
VIQWETRRASCLLMKRVTQASLTGSSSQLDSNVTPARNKAGRRETVTLSQVNRQLRAEFQKYRVPQNQHAHIYVSVASLDSYLETFFPGTADPTASDHPAKLTVIFTGDDKRKFNVIPLMELLQRALALAYDVFTISKVFMLLRNAPPGAPSAFWHAVVRQQDQPAYNMVFSPLRRHLTTVLVHMVYCVSFTGYDANRSLDIVINNLYGGAWMRVGVPG